MSAEYWNYPGSRWRKFDFHTHTPASVDTTAWQDAIGTENEVTPEKWLLKFMAAGIDCVAVTDHNSGSWVGKLKRAYTEMAAQDLVTGQPIASFRDLTIFPGVEISTNGGVHVLAIFDPQATTSDIDSLLGAVGYTGTKGDSDGETSRSLEEVIQIILNANAIPVPAHADQDKGVLQVKSGTRQCRLSAATVKQALEVEGLLAVEWCDETNQWPQLVESARERLAQVLGSDCHNFRGTAVPGSRYTWVKMAEPSLEGLRLALLDGNDVSIRRVEDGARDNFDPFRVPSHVIRSIRIERARVMGNENGGAVLACSPFFNAIVGGRGTGKSTVVHALRLATRRYQELADLGRDNEPQKLFEQFRQVAGGRSQQPEGALRDETEIQVEWQHREEGLDGHFRLTWRADGSGNVVEEWDGSDWRPADSQDVNARRFPLRIFSQGQIAAMASDGRRALLSIIDESDLQIGRLRQACEQARQTFFAQRARQRELEQELQRLPEVERLLAEAGKKLAALEQTDHAAVLRNYGQAQRQARVVKTLLEELEGYAAQIEQLSGQLLLDDWPEQYFGKANADLLAWRGDAERKMAEVRRALSEQVKNLRAHIESSRKDERIKQWHQRVKAAKQAHDELQAQLAAQGVEDPQAFARLTQQRQELEAQRKTLLQKKSDQEALSEQIEVQKQRLLSSRRAITVARTAFLHRVIENNQHVRMHIEPFGYDDEQLEIELRELIDALDGRFESGVNALLAEAANDRDALVQNIKQRLLNADASLGGHLQNYLQRKHEQHAEFADHIEAWFPGDDLRIEYQRDGQWEPITQGSQGQRSAALLAFLLAFGDEPMVLDQPEDDLDNHLIYQLIVQQIRENKLRRQLIIVTHNPNVVVNGDAELVHVMEFGQGQCYVKQSGALQEQSVRTEVCRVMEGGREAFARRWRRLGKGA